MAYQPYLISLLTDIVRVLNEQRYDYALAGGLAYSALVAPRATLDVDVLILMPDRPPAALFDGLRSALGVLVPHPAPMAFKRATIWRVIGGEGEREVTLDFILAESEFHRTALRRKRAVTFAGLSLPIVTPEDLVLLKALADRPQDRADIHGIVAAYGAELDREYLKNWANRLGLDLDLGNEGGANTDRKEQL